MIDKTDAVKYPLTIRSRLWHLIYGIKAFTETWVWVADESGYFQYYPWRDRFEDFLSNLDTAIRGYLLFYRLSTQTANSLEIQEET